MKNQEKTKKFYTRIKYNHPLYKDYVVGRINGIMYAMCENTDDEHPCFAQKRTDTGLVMTTLTTKKKWKRYARAVAKCYPGLCVFYDQKEL